MHFGLSLALEIGKMVIKEVSHIFFKSISWLKVVNLEHVSGINLFFGLLQPF